MTKYTIDLNKFYIFPKEIKYVEYEDSILVIAPETANWIVLKSKKQKNVLEFLKVGHTINETLENQSFNKNDVNAVVTQLEARRFCTKKVHSSTEEERTMHIYITNRCNLSCPHCYMYSGKANKNELTTEEILKLIYDYRHIANGSCVTLSGGEPTCRTDFDKIVQYAAGLGLEVKILTNGTLMTPERISRLAKYIYSAQISIDGYSEESNSLIRGKGSFNKSLLSVDSCVKNGIRTSIAITPSEYLLANHIDDYVEFATKLSIHYKGKPFRIKFAEGLMKGRKISPSVKDNKTYYTLMKELQTKFYGPNYEVMTFVHSLYNDSIIDNCMFGMFAIASNGDVFYCARISDLIPTTNVRDMPFQKIIERASQAEKASFIKNLKPCKDCELRFICGGGCRIEQFPKLVKRSSFENIDSNAIPPRSCDRKIKEKFYSLMIHSNKYFYKPLT